MKQIVLCYLLLSNLTLFSQSNFHSESYRVTLGDLETNTFEKDSTANALMVYKFGNSFVDKDDYKLRTEIKQKIKILNKEGFNKANISIHLYNKGDSKQKVKKIVATTYNLEDGNVIKTQLLEKDIFREKYDENHTLVKFTLPNIKEGSVITYSYTRISPFMFNYKGWNFQSDIPTLYNEYRTSIPGNWYYNIKLVGGKKLITNTSEIKKNCLENSRGASADCGNSVYAMRDMPAFIEEDYMTSKYNYLARVEYELQTFKGFDGRVNNYTKTWKTVDREFRTDKDIGRQLTKSIDLENLLNLEIINEKDLLKKANTIYRYVQENYTWNGDYKIFEDVSIKNLIKNKSGNVSAINILLHNLLKESGINVKPVLLSTRNNGFATKVYPVISDFNYLIVQANINDKIYYLDATDNYLCFGDIPFRCLNSYGRLMDFKNGSKWVDLKPSKASNVYYNAEVNINEKETISGNIISKRTGYHALNYKKSYYQNSESYVQTLENKFPYLDISDFEVTSNGKTSEDFKESYHIDYNYEDTGDNIYLNPFFVKFFNENPFKLQERTYPIDFGYKDTYHYSFKLSFDDNKYTIIELPEEKNIALPNNSGRVLFSTRALGNTIFIMLKITFNKAIYEPEYYPYLKAFMSEIVNIQTNSLILLKKK
ncbi:DUF3857 domain-containing protein [Flavivirga spongiicola]|uniref:DUF3857 domain-containing protein n=1 Tax=Flavivirga spongiicola TaxID=421621 RepID=A0ABU7XZY1_9FLAO|nr:DUF3857 domain-containing protein [Flavivirga sp. MEBiC05379]MDO5981015.1 DUF3857 domain-containing protein [Flavivirga sp. MEBiC05379]